MSSAESAEVSQLLESPGALANLMGSVREPWLARGLLAHLARTGSGSALEALARAPEPHVRHTLDALHDMLRQPDTARLAAAAAARLAARRAPWLPRLAAHPAARDLARLARPGPARPALHAALALAALVLAAPHAAPALWPELGDALARLAAWRAPASAADHVRLGLLALFRALYATHPAALLDTLRAECAARDEPFRRAAAGLARTVRLHPALLTPQRAWTEADSPSALDELRRCELEPAPEPGPPASARPARPAAPGSPAAAPPPPGHESWFSLAERCGAGSAPPTPLPAEPETAVEATPENTPVKELRAQFQFPGSPLPDAAGARLARLVRERARESPVPMGEAPPERGVARPLAVRPVPPRPAPPRPAAPRPARARSCPALVGREGPHEELVADLVEAVDKSFAQMNGDPESESSPPAPAARLDAFLERLYCGASLADGAPAASEREQALREQLALTHAQLLFERWRREAHADRNRRLLGRCRRARALEQDNGALRDRLLALQLQPRRPGPSPPPPPPGPAPAAEPDPRAGAAALADAQAEAERARQEARALRAALADCERRGARAGRAGREAARAEAAAGALRVELLLRGEREARLAAAAGAAAGAARLRRAQDERLLQQYRAEEVRLRGAAAAAAARGSELAAREAELEAALAARESALAAAAAQARLAAERHAAELGAVQDKYRALMHVLRRVESRRLERAAAPAPAPAPPPAAAPPALADLAALCRERDLLEDDDFPTY